MTKEAERWGFDSRYGSYRQEAIKLRDSWEKSKYPSEDRKGGKMLSLVFWGSLTLFLILFGTSKW